MKFRMLLAFVVLATVTLSAQTFRGTILGTVTDPSGAVVSGAKVTVRNTSTGLERTAQTSADGSYSIPELPIGTYSVTVSQAGFQTSVTTNVTVDVATERRVDFTLKTGEVSTRVEVSGEFLPQVETTSAVLGGTLTAETITKFAREWPRLHQVDLPESGRCRLSRSDLGLAGLLRHLLDEWIERPVQQFPARRHRHE